MIFRKNLKVFEPKSWDEGLAIEAFVTCKRGDKEDVWVDIQDRGYMVGLDQRAFLALTYVGSLSTIDPMPTELWCSRGKEGFYRL